jgi:drug/metabolite transporter (DMT)-like permease
MKNKTVLADLSLLFVALVWGTTFVLVQNAISLLEPFSFNAVRFLIAAIFLFLWLLFFNRKQLQSINWPLVQAGVILGIWLCAGYAFQTFGLLYTTSSKAGFITGLSVVLVPLLTFLLLKQKIKTNALIGAILALIGLYLLTLGETLQLNKGDLLVLFCAFSFALQIIITGRYAKQFPALALTFIQISTVGILCLILSLIFEDAKKMLSPEIIVHPSVIFALIITSLFATALAFLIQTSFQKYTSATRVALIFAMEPVFAALTGFLWNDESLGTKAILGCLLILIGMVLSELPPWSKMTKKAFVKERA